MCNGQYPVFISGLCFQIGRKLKKKFPLQCFHFCNKDRSINSFPFFISANEMCKTVFYTKTVIEFQQNPIPLCIHASHSDY